MGLGNLWKKRNKEKTSYGAERKKRIAETQRRKKRKGFGQAKKKQKEKGKRTELERKNRGEGTMKIWRAKQGASALRGKTEGKMEIEKRYERKEQGKSGGQRLIKVEEELGQGKNFLEKETRSRGRPCFLPLFFFRALPPTPNLLSSSRHLPLPHRAQPSSKPPQP